MTSFNFAEALLEWFDHHGRHDLPWQTPDDPYRVWLSEVMLQQTQVKTVIPYFESFLQAFPTLESLAEAKIDQVLAAWTGLGYYARARNLHRTAVIIHQDLGGKFPDNQIEWAELPGVGPSTAAAITSICFNERVAILDGNVKRVLTRFFAEPGWPGTSRVANKLWAQAESLLPDTRFGDYTQAIMDLGATVCTPFKPACGICPWRKACDGHLLGLAAELPKKSPKKERPLSSSTVCTDSGRCLVRLVWVREEEWCGKTHTQEIDEGASGKRRKCQRVAIQFQLAKVSRERYLEAEV